MNDDPDFCLQHCHQIERCLEHIEELLAQARWDTYHTYQTIAFGTLLQNACMGVESILRYEIMQRGEKVGHGESWHKDLLR